jgi:hypothetical protein
VLISDAEVCLSYQQLRERIIELLANTRDEIANKTVPACPKWTVQNLVCHIIGVPEDILEGRMKGVTTDPWTQAQVDRHKSDSIAQLREILISQKSKFDVVLPNIPSPVNSQFVMDAVTHEHDLREALGKPGAQDSLAVNVAFAWLASNSIYPKELVDKLRASKATEFQLMRAMTGRISVEQMNELNLPGDEIASLTEGSPFKAPPSKVAN